MFWTPKENTPSDNRLEESMRESLLSLPVKGGAGEGAFSSLGWLLRVILVYPA